MTIDDLIQIAANRPLTLADLVEADRKRSLSISQILDALADRVAHGYLEGSYAWDVGDAVMNGVFEFAVSHGEYPLVICRTESSAELRK